MLIITTSVGPHALRRLRACHPVAVLLLVGGTVPWQTQGVPPVEIEIRCSQMLSNRQLQGAPRSLRTKFSLFT